jgi:pyrimidine and pyridine-specific 5'-nucleotidase
MNGAGSMLQLMADPNLPPSATGSVWEGDGNTATSFGMETEIMEHDDVDEDLADAIDAVQIAHSRKVLHFKRLLESAHSNSASQLHALQAELKLLRATLDKERAINHQNELARDRDRLSLSLRKVGRPAEMHASHPPTTDTLS